MRQSKKMKLEAIVNLFHKEKVLKLDKLFKVLDTTSRRTVHRYMIELEYRTSYSHSGQYYTLFEITEFDENGLWYYGDVGFSKHGSLLDTIIYLVDRSPGGMTNNDLQKKIHLVIRASLINLVKKKLLAREKRKNQYVYLSYDSAKGQQQLKKRDELFTDALVDDSTALRVLLMAYQLAGRTISPEEVANGLKKEGSRISLEIVYRVFQKYDIGKKTQGLISSQS